MCMKWKMMTGAEETHEVEEDDRGGGRGGGGAVG